MSYHAIDGDYGYTSTYQIDSALFGADLLGYRYSSDPFYSADDALGVSSVRWSGGSIAEGYSSKWDDENYGLDNQFVLHKYNDEGELSGRDNLQTVLEDSVENGHDLTIVAPMQRYITLGDIPEDGAASVSDPRDLYVVDVEEAREVGRQFILDLASGDRFGIGVDYELPGKITMQFGQEYYHYDDMLPAAGDAATNEALWEGYCASLGELYGEVAVGMKEALAEVQANPELYEHTEFELDIVVEIGRLSREPDYTTADQAFSGSFEDAETISSAISAEGFEAIDGLLWQRYTADPDTLTQGYSTTWGDRLTLEEAETIWQDAAAAVGVEGKDFDIVVGSSISSLTRSEGRRLYEEDTGQKVSDEAFAFDVRSDRSFEEHYQDLLRDGAWGQQTPAAIIDLFAEFASAEVSSASSYTAELIDASHQGGRLTAIDVETNEAVALASGQMYGRLSETIVGMHEIHGGSVVVTQDNSSGVNMFRDADTVVIYAHATDLDGSLDVAIELGGIAEQIDGMSSLSLTQEPIDDWQARFGIVDLTKEFDDFDQTAEAAIYSDLHMEALDFEIDQSGVLRFTLDEDWEVAEFIIELEADDTNGIDDGVEVFGSPEADVIEGGSGSDVLVGRAGDDVLTGAGGTDSLSGRSGADLLVGGADADTLHGGSDGDRLEGGSGGDKLYGNKGDDDLFGEGGNDVLRGASGSDYLDGGDGNDLLDGGEGDDVLVGRGGEDQFSFRVADSNSDGTNDFGTDTVVDFDPGRDEIRVDIPGASSVSDFKMWRDESNERFVIKDRESGDRMYLEGDYDWSEVASEENFDFA